MRLFYHRKMLHLRHVAQKVCYIDSAGDWNIMNSSDNQTDSLEVSSVVTFGRAKTPVTALSEGTSGLC